MIFPVCAASLIADNTCPSGSDGVSRLIFIMSASACRFDLRVCWMYCPVKGSRIGNPKASITATGFPNASKIGYVLSRPAADAMAAARSLGKSTTGVNTPDTFSRAG